MEVLIPGRTLVHDSAENIDPSGGGGTVPAAVPELVLTLNWKCKRDYNSLDSPHG